MQHEEGVFIGPLVNTARLSKMQARTSANLHRTVLDAALLHADFTSQLTTKVARVLDNLHEVWRHFVAPYARENPDPSEYKDSRWGVMEDDSEEGVKVRVSPVYAGRHAHCTGLVSSCRPP